MSFDPQITVSPKSPPTYPIFSLLVCLGLGLFTCANSDGLTFLLAAAFGIWFLLSLSRYNRSKAEFKRESQYISLQRVEQIKALSPVDFENYVGYLFERMGYRVSTTAVTGDQGVDLFLDKPDEKAIVQCKRYEGTVGQPVLRDLYGTMMHYQVAKGYLVTTGRVSAQARQWVVGKPIQLVDGKALQTWVHKVERGASSELSRSPTSISKSNSKPLRLSYSLLAILLVVILLVSISRGQLRSTTNISDAPQISSSTTQPTIGRLTSAQESEPINTPRSFISTKLPTTAESTSTNEVDGVLEAELSHLTGVNFVQRVNSVRSVAGYTVFVTADVETEYVHIKLAKDIQEVIEAVLEGDVIQISVILEDAERGTNYVWSKANNRWTIVSD